MGALPVAIKCFLRRKWRRRRAFHFNSTGRGDAGLPDEVFDLIFAKEIRRRRRSFLYDIVLERHHDGEIDGGIVGPDPRWAR